MVVKQVWPDGAAAKCPFPKIVPGMRLLAFGAIGSGGQTEVGSYYSSSGNNHHHDYHIGGVGGAAAAVVGAQLALRRMETHKRPLQIRLLRPA